MASPTVNKGYTYPAHGGGVGTWDSNLNGNFEYQDLNLGGYYPITATSTTAAVTFNSSYATIPSTCQSITFSASLAQNLFYYLSGAVTSSLAINMPAAGSIYVFGNAVSSGTVAVGPTAGTQQTLTSGGQSVIVTTSSAAFFGQNAFGAISTLSISNSSGITSNGPITQNSSQYGKLASGDTGSRPAATAAYFRYNTTLGQPEWSDGVSWYPVGAQAIAAGFKNLRIANNAATPNTKIDVTADAVTVETTSGTAYRPLTISVTIDCGTTGANGLDAGGLANSTWYSVWVIYNPTTATVAGLASTSATAPTMPAGYTAKARLGWMRTNTSAQFLQVIQYGRRAQYVVGSSGTTTSLPLMASGAAGNSQTGVYVAVSVANFVPTTASAIYAAAQSQPNTGILALAPNNNFAGQDSTSNGPPHAVNDSNVVVPLLLESTNIYWATPSGVSCYLRCLGWEDNI